MSDYLDSIRLTAMKSVTDPDFSAWLRRVSRWFSSNFHTPLPEVENLPTEYILQHYFEKIYEDLDAEERAKQIKYLLESPHQRTMREEKEKLEEEMWIREAEEEAKKLSQNDKKQVTNINAPSMKPQMDELPEIKVNFVDSDTFEELLNVPDPMTKK